MEYKVLDGKRIAKNTALLYIRMMFTVFISMYTSRVTLDVLGSEDFGIYGIVGGVVSFMWILNGVLHASTSRNITFELGQGNKKQLSLVFGNAITIHALISLIIIIVSETIGLWFMNTQLVIPESRMYAAQWVYQTALVCMILGVMSVPFNACLVAHENMKAYAYITILDVLLKLGIVFVLDLTCIDKLILYSILMMATQILNQIIYMWYGKRCYEEIRFIPKYDKVIFKDMLSFAGWNLVGTGSAIIMSTGHGIILNQFFGPLVNAAKSLSGVVQGKVGSLCGNFQMALNPQIFKSYAMGNMEYMHKLIFASSKFSYFLIFILALPICCEVDGLLDFWLKEIPANTASFTILTLATLTVNALANPQGIAAQATGKIKKFQLMEASILLCILPFTWLTLHMGLAPVSAFYIYLLFHVIAVVGRALMLRKMIGLSIRKYATKVVLPVGLVTIIMTAVGLFVHNVYDSENIMIVIARCAIIVLITIVAIYYMGLQPTERKMAIVKIKSIIHRK